MLLAATLLSQAGCGALLPKKLGGYTSPENVDALSLVGGFRQLINDSTWYVLDKQSAQSDQMSRFPQQKQGADLIPSRYFELVTVDGNSLRGIVAGDPEADGFHCSAILTDPARGGRVVRKDIELTSRSTVIAHPGTQIGHLSFSEGGFKMQTGNVTCYGGDNWVMGGECVIEGVNVLGQSVDVSQGAGLEQAYETAQALCEELTDLVDSATTMAINEKTQAGPHTTIVGEMQ